MSVSVVEIGPGLRMCLHPNATLECRTTRGRWRKWQSGRRWRLERAPGHGMYVKACPDCPAVLYQLDMGMAVQLALAPWLVSVKEEGQR